VFPDNYSPYSESPFQRLLRLMQASFRLGRFFGVEVRVFWIALIVLPLFTLYEFWSWLPLLGAMTVLGLTVFISVGLYFIIWTHEMSHIAAGWRYGINTPLITISPLGGLAHMGSSAPRPSAEVVISLAGPAVHVLWLAVVAPFHFMLDSIFALEQFSLRFAVEFLWDINLVLMVFNLLPVFPMDGGRVLRALLAMRIHPNRATVIAARVGMVGAVLLALYGLFYEGLYGTILVFIGISIFFACRRELVAARYQISPYGGASASRAPWELDPEAWKQGGSDSSAPQARETSPGRLERWRERRRARKKDEVERRKGDLDRVLARITEVGMDGLTKAERKTLEQASRDARER
jgi:Zn-dependent protease